MVFDLGVELGVGRDQVEVAHASAMPTVTPTVRPISAPKLLPVPRTDMTLASTNATTSSMMAAVKRIAPSLVLRRSKPMDAGWRTVSMVPRLVGASGERMERGKAERHEGKAQGGGSEDACHGDGCGHGEDTGEVLDGRLHATLKDQQQQSDVSQCNKRLFPCPRKPSRQRCAKDDADEDLAEETRTDGRLYEPARDVEE